MKASSKITHKRCSEQVNCDWSVPVLTATRRAPLIVPKRRSSCLPCSRSSRTAQDGFGPVPSTLNKRRSQTRVEPDAVCRLLFPDPHGERWMSSVRPSTHAAASFLLGRTFLPVKGRLFSSFPSGCSGPKQPHCYLLVPHRRRTP